MKDFSAQSLTSRAKSPRPTSSSRQYRKYGVFPSSNTTRQHDTIALFKKSKAKVSDHKTKAKKDFLQSQAKQPQQAILAEKERQTFEISKVVELQNETRSATAQRDQLFLLN